MGFSKFDPHKPEEVVDKTAGDRRALLLKIATWTSMVYTTIGFGFITYWLMT